MPSDPPSRDRTPKRLHPISLFFGCLTVLRHAAVPIVFAGFAAGGGSWAGYALVLALVPAMIGAGVRYWNYRYLFDDDQLVIRDGILTRNERHVRYARVQNIDTSQNPLHRMFDVAVVRLETASGGKPEAVISVLSLDAVEEMRRRVFAGRAAATDGAGEATAGDPATGTDTARATDGADAAVATPEQRLLEVTPSELVRAGLISNKGFVVVGVAVGLLQQTGFFERSDIWESTANRLLAWAQNLGLGSGEEGLGSLRRVVTLDTLTQHPVLLGLAILLAFVAFVSAVRLLSIAWTFVTLYGFTLRRRGEDLRTNYGLFTRVTATIPRRRIQLASVRQTFLHRRFHRASMMVETAGGGEEADGQSGGGGGGARLRLAPIVEPGRVPDLMREFLPGVDLESVEWRPLAPRTFRRFMRRASIWSLLLAAPAVVFWKLAGLVALPLLVGLFVLRAKLYVRYTAWALTPEAVVFRSGWWTRRLSAVKFQKIQALEFRQSWFDRRYGMAAVAVDTAGAGRTGHRVDVRYLEADTARDLLARLESEAAATDFRW